MCFVHDVTFILVSIYLTGSDGYVGQAAVQITNGHCNYEGKRIPVNNSISLEKPCALRYTLGQNAGR
ncbi:uncharacterized protein LOC144097204 isoform X2 [Amblyomma americanum]